MTAMRSCWALAMMARMSSRWTEIRARPRAALSSSASPTALRRGWSLATRLPRRRSVWPESPRRVVMEGGMRHSLRLRWLRGCVGVAGGWGSERAAALDDADEDDDEGDDEEDVDQPAHGGAGDESEDPEDDEDDGDGH